MENVFSFKKSIKEQGIVEPSGVQCFEESKSFEG